jgi:hypothetical protein
MPAPSMSSLPAQTQPENASNSTNGVAKIAMGLGCLWSSLTPYLLAGPMRRFFKASYVQIIQFITLIVLWAVAARSYPLGFLEYIFPLVLIVRCVSFCFYMIWPTHYGLYLRYSLPLMASIKYDELQAEGRPAVVASRCGSVSLYHFERLMFLVSCIATLGSSKSPVIVSPPLR